MNYIWQAVTEERRGGAALSDISFVPARNFSPYMEVNQDALNAAAVPDDGRIEVNPFIRFHDIFADFLRPGIHEFPEYRERLFDICMHFLLAADQRSGYDRRSVWVSLFCRDVADGVYDTEIADMFALLGKKGKNVIASGLVSLYKCGASLHLHGAVFRTFFPNRISYLKIQGERALLLYIPCKKTPENEAAALLCEAFFLPLDLKTDYYWERHFGILGVPETMRLGEMVLA
jgi:hypothetical protein